MNEIEYIHKGNVLEPIGEGNKLIIHCANSIGKWGSGFVLALSKKWKEPEKHYRKWAKDKVDPDGYYPNPIPFSLGFIQPIQVAKDIVVINMIAQEGVGHDQHGFPPVRYWALDECLKKVAKLAKAHQCTVHIPYLCACDLAGGVWVYVECMLNYRLISEDIKVFVYDINGVRF